MLTALHEAGTGFEAIAVNPAEPGDHARLLDLWPVGKMPVLHDGARDRKVPESSIIIESLDRNYPGRRQMLPADPSACLEARLWDRFFDLHVMTRCSGSSSTGFEPRTGAIRWRWPRRSSVSPPRTAWSSGGWGTGRGPPVRSSQRGLRGRAGAVLRRDHRALRRRPVGTSGYFERLVDRPSYRRVLVEAQPYFDTFPFRDRMPERFLTLGDA